MQARGETERDKGKNFGKCATFITFKMHPDWINTENLTLLICSI